MIPPFDANDRLPAGIHWTEWREFQQRFGTNPHRMRLMGGLKRALDALQAAHCQTVYIDGSFVTNKEFPGDFDGCWSMAGVDPQLLDLVFLDFSNARAAQKAKYLGEFFPAELPEGISGRVFLEFFQIDKDTGEPKGIIALDLRRLP